MLAHGIKKVVGSLTQIFPQVNEHQDMTAGIKAKLLLNLGKLHILQYRGFPNTARTDQGNALAISERGKECAEQAAASVEHLRVTHRSHIIIGIGRSHRHSVPHVFVQAKKPNLLTYLSSLKCYVVPLFLPLLKQMLRGIYV